MTNRDLLSEFINDDYFKQTVTLITRSISYLKGRVVTAPDVETEIDCIIQNVSPKTLINLGLGQYTNNQSYSVFTKTSIDQSENNYIRYEGKLFKILETSPWNYYGFNKYIINQYNEEELNDN